MNFQRLKRSSLMSAKNVLVFHASDDNEGLSMLVKRLEDFPCSVHKYQISEVEKSKRNGSIRNEENLKRVLSQNSVALFFLTPDLAESAEISSAANKVITSGMPIDIVYSKKWGQGNHLGQFEKLYDAVITPQSSNLEKAVKDSFHKKEGTDGKTCPPPKHKHLKCKTRFEGNVEQRISQNNMNTEKPVVDIKRPPKIYTYKLDRDYGFAPNPFGGYCTLACCKPDVRRLAIPGDWVIGIGTSGNKLLGKVIYAMIVEETLTFDEYWKDSRFDYKKSIDEGSHKRFYGDNVYSYNKSKKEFVQHKSHHSLESGEPNLEHLAVDTKTNKVLIGSKFVYFGRNPKEPPTDISIIPKGCSMKFQNYCSKYTENEIKKIQSWLKTYDWGFHDIPVAWGKKSK